MKPAQTLAVVAAICAAVTPMFLISCASHPGAVVAPLEIPGAHFVGNPVCAQCHADLVREFPASPHARLRMSGAGVEPASSDGDSRDAGTRGQDARATGVGCESCHGPGSKHVAAGGGAKFIINPGKDPDACFRCHLPVRAEFELSDHHPVTEGRMSCADCHDPHGGDIFKPAASGLAMARMNENCSQCHREQTRPFVFEHPAVREGCTTCHNPHGSVNRALLTAADDNLCLRCHAQTQTAGGQIFIGNVDHTPLLQMGACWSCHTAIHGSDADPRLRY